MARLHASGSYSREKIIILEEVSWSTAMTDINWAVGVVVSHPLSMREAQGSIP